MKFLLGQKKMMTQVFTEEGESLPVTVIKAGPVVVTQVKTKEKDGYEAVQVGFLESSERKVKKPQQGAAKKNNLPLFKYFGEYRFWDSKEDLKIGDKFDVSVFNTKDVIEVTGTSKGKGFQGVVKRHGFAGGRRTHGQKHSEREPGSIGGGARAGGRVAKGMRMAGRMGGDRVTLKNLKVVGVDSEKNELYVLGAIPGRTGTLVEITG